MEDLYGDRRGALVAIDPRNGEVLALVSKPTFDPNLFVEGIDPENWTALNESIDKPLLNRALRGPYPPGSTYKPFMALAALELNKRSAQHDRERPRLLHLRRPHLPQPTKAAWARVDMHRGHPVLQQHLLLLAGRGDGRERHPLFHEAPGLRADHGHRPQR